VIERRDQLNFLVKLQEPAKRIISLVPSQTELLHHFGLEEETIGITKFCIHPKEWHLTKKRVGGTKNLNLDAIRELCPDLIIANKEENTKEEIEILQEEFNVYISDIETIAQSYKMIEDVGCLCGKEQLAADLIDDIQESFEGFQKGSGNVAYFIWKDPYMVCGQSNFINEVIGLAGFDNVIQEDRYVELSSNHIEHLAVNYIFLSSEPFPFKKDHFEEFSKLSHAKIVLVDGEMFSWYGSRMLKLRKYLDDLIRDIS
jgi:ABC-type Fe3+-hydroxamate transport system substrate-binding protein